MKEKKLRTFIVNGKTVIFNVPYFKELFVENAQKNNMGLIKYENVVADALYVDSSAVHNWRNNKNGPGDLEKIKLLAALWHVTYESLLVEVKNMENSVMRESKKLTDIERAALKNVYTSFMHYMDEFVETTGFLWDKDGADYNIQYAYFLYNQLKKTLKYEYIDLSKNLYTELEDFFNGDLLRTLEMEIVEGDYPELLKMDAKGAYIEMTEQFKAIVDVYL